MSFFRSEYNLLPFFKQTLPQEVEEAVLEDGNVKVTLTKVDKIEGDFNAMNRKGKTFVFVKFYL
jgi:activator of HSP90 ATPase